MIVPVWGFWLAVFMAWLMVASAGTALLFCGRWLAGSMFALFWGGLGGFLLIALCQGWAA
ncbi:hypothetical protein NS365_01220 [Aureimonas ureilytica]|uniref:Uncharacterized protein n=1 Tax=Aureimonas ureilytica TaxID=401562 RepID=A0A147DBN5_9HYPH|nr:hypothetical protein [Aureimonas ureilytica]KTR08586.1 hypothetical protein NS365_01220 [Aureimonas ureilytica]